MASPPAAPGGSTQVVVAFLDGRRLKGYLFAFSALRDHCTVFPTPAAHAPEGETVLLKNLKAMFFIKEAADAAPNPAMAHGRKIEVTFSDGERLTGTTEGYSRDRLGFFMAPVDPTGKILRIFVVNANVTNVRWVQ